MPPPRPKPKRLGCASILLILLLIGSGLLNVLLIGDKATGGSGPLDQGLPRFEETIVESGQPGSFDKIAVIAIRGVISQGAESELGTNMVEDTKRALRQAERDNNVKAIVLEIDSPGGEVTAADAIFHAVKQVRSKKPIVVYMQSLAASGGYYIACGGTWLMASETTLTGSIGVIIQTLKYKELLGKVGVEAITFKSGQFKDMLNGARDMTPEEREYIQRLVMQMYDKFLGIVATERDLDADQLRTTVADGRVISGRDAYEAKLVNQLGYFEDALSKARELGDAPGAKVVRYAAPFNLARMLRIFGSTDARKVEINISESVLPKLEPGKMYLLPSHFAL